MLKNKKIFGETIINNILKEDYFFVSNTKMVDFDLAAPTHIFLKEFTERYSTFDQGCQVVLTSLEERLDNLEQGEYINLPQKILIGRAVDRRFFYRPTGRKGRNIFGEFVGAKITEVSYHNSL